MSIFKHKVTPLLILDIGPEECGLGTESGSRKVIVKEREILLSKVLKKTLEDLED